MPPPRSLVASRGLVAPAADALGRDVLGGLSWDALAEVKGLLKRHLSAQPWSGEDDERLAELVGPGEGWWEVPLDDQLRLAYGWRDGRFGLEVRSGDGAGGDDEGGDDEEPWDAFDGPVVPEATPNPRSIRFVTGPLGAAESRQYVKDGDVDDTRAAALFEAFPGDVEVVLVGPDFVAVTLRRPDRWEELLGAVLDVVTDRFGAASDVKTSPTLGSPALDVRGGGAGGTPGRTTALGRAWDELGALRPGERPDDLHRLLDASRAPDVASRRVAAHLLRDAPEDEARIAWQALLADASRSVRRTAVDAMVDAEREALRPLLEQALRDTDAWTRWKALHGLRRLGVGASREAVRRLAEDSDFRVRLEAAAALRRAGEEA